MPRVINSSRPSRSVSIYSHQQLTRLLTRWRETGRLEQRYAAPTALATLCLWWIGLHAREQGWQRYFQANTTRHRPVLSALFLALQVVKHYGHCLSATELIRADQLLRLHIAKSQFL